MDPEQTAPIYSLIWVHTVCHRGFLNISADEKSRRLFYKPVSVEAIVVGDIDEEDIVDGGAIVVPAVVVIAPT